MNNLPELQGDGLVLKPLGPEDAAAMFASLTDEEAMRLTGSHDEFTFDQVLRFCESVSLKDDRVDYSVYMHEQPERSVGELVLNDIDAENRSCNFRVALYGGNNFGRGIGSRAIPLILGYGFDVLHLHRIELEVFAFNPRAIHLYEKLGFVREGIKRDSLFWDGEYQDAICMAMLEGELRLPAG